MEQLATFLDAIPQGVVAVNSKGKIVIVNIAATQMFGYQPGELKGRTLEMLIPLGSRAGHPKDVANFFANPLPRVMGIGMELSAIRKDRTEFPVEVSLGLWPLDSGSLAVAFVADISTRKKMEEIQRQAVKWEVIGQMASGIAHDFNNHLTITSGYLSMIKEALLGDEKMQGLMTPVLQASGRMTDLARQLLCLSRKESRNKQAVNLNEIIAAEAGILRTLVHSNRVVFDTELKSPNAAIWGDPNLIQQLLMNLVANARDAMPNGGTLTIRTSSGNEQVMLEVADTGLGMSMETLHFIFEPFFTTKEPGRGTGLGLAAVQTIVESHGGKINVTSKLGQGTSFKISFPQVQETQ